MTIVFWLKNIDTVSYTHLTNEEMSKLVQASVEHRSDVLAQILHPEALEVLESASAEFEPEKAEPVPMPTPQTEEFRCYHVPDEFMKVYKSLKMCIRDSP